MKIRWLQALSNGRHDHVGTYKFGEVRDRFKSNTGSFVGRNFSQHEVVRFDIMALGALKKLFLFI